MSDEPAVEISLNVLKKVSIDNIIHLEKYIVVNEGKLTIHKLTFRNGGQALRSKVKKRPEGQTKSTRRAAELASKVIDERIEADAPAGERESRKRRLLKGPSAFRDVRKDGGK